MKTPSPQALAQLQSASQALRAGNPAAAIPVLAAVAAAEPEVLDAHRLLGLAHRDAGNRADAEAALRRALALAPGAIPVATPLGQLLTDGGRPAEAIDLLAPIAAISGDLALLSAYGGALKAAGRLDEAAAAHAKAAAAQPGAPIPEHNLAAVLGDDERYADSEAAARRALAKGLDAPETWLVLARALRGQGRPEDAEAAYNEAIRRRLMMVDAHRELSQLVWMRTGDLAEASRLLDAALAAAPQAQNLALAKAELQEFSGDPEAALDTVTRSLAQLDTHPIPRMVAVRLAAGLDPELALRHAERAVELGSGERGPLVSLCQAYLAVGRAADAARLAEQLRADSPLDQHAIAYLATAWRMLGDPRAGELYDYDGLVRGWRIDTPDGWPTLEAYLADLAPALLALHTYRTHPVGQSLRNGSQTSQSLTRSDDPAIKAFFQAIDGPIRRHMAWLGRGDGPVRSRNTGDYALNGIWSVKLSPNGFHADHIHHMGWLSSACYIALPSAVEQGHEGWLKFGEPGVPTRPTLGPEHFLKPEPGLLALFPSYMWHGTVPFGGDQPRLTIAFDIVPR